MPAGGRELGDDRVGGELDDPVGHSLELEEETGALRQVVAVKPEGHSGTMVFTTWQKDGPKGWGRRSHSHCGRPPAGAGPPDHLG